MTPPSRRPRRALPNGARRRRGVAARGGATAAVQLERATTTRATPGRRDRRRRRRRARHAHGVTPRRAVRGFHEPHAVSTWSPQGARPGALTLSHRAPRWTGGAWY